MLVDTLRTQKCKFHIGYWSGSRSTFSSAIDPAEKEQMQKSTSSLWHLTDTTAATTPNTRFFFHNYMICNPNN